MKNYKELKKEVKEITEEDIMNAVKKLEGNKKYKVSLFDGNYIDVKFFDDDFARYIVQPNGFLKYDGKTPSMLPIENILNILTIFKRDFYSCLDLVLTNRK